MKKMLYMSMFFCAIFILSAIPAMGQSNDSQSPYRLVTSLEEARAVIRMRDGSIPVTNVEVPEIMRGEVDGIIITEQDLNEALEVLNEAYAESGYVIHNLTTIYVKFSLTPEEQDLLREEARRYRESALERSYDFEDGREVYSVEPRATRPPTNLFPLPMFIHNWSGTINFTYTRYLADARWAFINSRATTDHHINFVGRNGADLGTRLSRRSAEFFIVNSPTFSQDFYGIIHNRPWGTPSRNATYTISD